MRFLRFLILLAILAALASRAARFLVIDDPQKADVIVVLAGETGVRPARGVQLLERETAPRMFVDAETHNQIYNQSLYVIAQKYVGSLPDASRIDVCPIEGLSTDGESDDVRRCLQSLGVHRVLLVTSDFHTRRALSVFQHRMPQYQFSIAAAHDPLHFGTAWWTHREWAKVTFDEWIRLIWWEAVDRWR
jgi:hypothetical protein